LPPAAALGKVIIICSSHPAIKPSARELTRLKFCMNCVQAIIDTHIHTFASFLIYLTAHLYLLAESAAVCVCARASASIGRKIQSARGQDTGRRFFAIRRFMDSDHAAPTAAGNETCCTDAAANRILILPSRLTSPR